MGKQDHAGGIGAAPVRALLAAAVLAVLSFLAITAHIVRGSELGVDSHTVRAIHRVVEPSLDPVMLRLESLGSANVAIFASIAAVLVLLLMRRFAEAVFVAAAVAGADEFARLMGHVVDQTAYPSGAATRSTAAVLAFAIVLWPTVWRRPAIAGGLLVIAAVGVARLYFRDDDASALLAGWSLATAWVAALALAGRPRTLARVPFAAQTLREPDLFLSFEALAERLQALLRRGPADDETRLDAFLVAAGMNQVLEDHLERDVLALRRAAAHLPRLLAALTLMASGALGRLRDAGPAHRRLVASQRGVAALVGDLAETLARGSAHGARFDAGVAASAVEQATVALRRRVLRLPNCFRSFDQRPEDCAALVDRFAARWPDRSRPLLVIGLRTSGSYLAPLHASLLRAAGYRDVSVITMRPGVPLNRHAAAAMSAAGAAGAIGLLVDDPPRTGSQLSDAAVEAWERGMDELVVMLQLAEGPDSVPDRLRMLPRVVLTGEEWAFRRQFEPAALERSLAALLGAADVTVESVGVLPPRRGHAVARVSARIDGVFRDIHAEGVGAGYFGRHALAVADRLSDFVPRVYGLRDGLLFREWLPEGLRLTPERLRADPGPAATTIARYVAARSRRLETPDDVALRLSGREAAWEHTAQLLGDAFGGARKFVRPLTEPAARRITRVAHPSVGDARTVPWEWFGDGSSGLRKAAFQQRATASSGLQSYDPVFDLAEAAAAAEAVGDLEFAGELLATYEAESGTAVEPERWLIHRLVHHLEAHRAALVEVAVGESAPAAFARALALERAMAGIQRRYEARPAGPPPTSGPLCAIDIDGVLESRWAVFPALTPDGAEALRALRVHGRRPVLVTGRSLDEVRERCADYGLAGGSAEYGSVIYDAHTGAHRSLLSPGAQAALSALRSALEQTPGVLLDPAHRHSVRAHTIGARGARRALDTAAIDAALETAGVADRVRVAQGVLQTDFVAAEIDKAAGLRALASELGAVRDGEPDVAFAIGDTAEDLPMLRLARNPWAPANAAPDLHEHAQIARAAYQPGLLAAVRAEVGHAHGDCKACRAPAPATREAALLRATLTALGGGRRVKAQQAVVLAARLVRISPSS